MKVFISWSKERSHNVALLIQQFLNCVLQEVDPWVSSGSIESGEIWFSSITKSLAETKVGILCLTPENKESPWIMFEAGALMKGLEENRVHILLLGLEKHDVAPPLSQFNLRIADKEGIHSLFHSINMKLNRPLSHVIFENVFSTYWQSYEPQLQAVLNKTVADTPLQIRNNEDLLSEILGHVRGLDKRIRHMEITSEHRQRRPRQVITVSLKAEVFSEALRNQIKLSDSNGITYLANRFELSEDIIHSILHDLYSQSSSEVIDLRKEEK